MVEFTVTIAGCSIGISALHPQARQLFCDYLTQTRPLFTIESSEALILKERQLMRQVNKKESRQIDGFSDSEMESNFLYREVAERLSRYGVLLLHGSAVAVDGKAYIFVAPSGTGKSTHTRLWRQVFGGRAVMINDDKPLLRCAEDGVTVYGSPWNGKHHLSANVSVPLKAICFLERGAENEIRRLDAREGFLPLLKAAYHSKTAENEAFILQTLRDIWQQTAFYRLSCNMQPQAALTAYNGMRGTP